MISKVFLSLVLARLALVRSDERIYSSPLLQTFGDEMFEAMTSVTQEEWNQTAINRQNFHIFPVLIKMRDHCERIKLYHEFFYDNATQYKFLKNPYTFGRILQQVKEESMIMVNIPNVIFHDKTKMWTDYIWDAMTYFNTDPREISFNKENEIWVLYEINRWFGYFANGQHPRKESVNVTGVACYHAMVLMFHGCWDTTKPSVTRITMNEYHRRIPPLNKGTIEKLLNPYEVDAFSAKANITYYNNFNQKYEAIQIPFNNFGNPEGGEFNMIVMLPYRLYSLEIFRNFTGDDYKHLFHELNNYGNYENIHFTIPIIKTKMFFINRIGVGINVNEFVGCREPQMRPPYDKDELDHRQFFVDRPFAVIIYNPKTQFVYLYALVRHASSEVSFMGRIDINGVKAPF